MVKIQLITSPNQKPKKNFKFLNYGCLNLSKDISKKDVLKDHPWDNRKRYYQDSIKIEKIYLYTLREISNNLNEHHKIKKNLRYWKILLGPWLNSFITAYYEKNLEIEQLLKIKKKITIQISNTNIEDQIPTNFFNHFTKKINDPSWHANLFSTILKKKKLGKNFFLKHINYPIVKTIRKNKINIFFPFKNKILNFLSLLFFPITRNQSLVFNSYLSFKDKLFLVFKNLVYPLI